MTGFGEFPLIRRHHNLLAAQGIPNITGPIQKGNGGGKSKTGGGGGPTVGKGHGKGNGAGGGGGTSAEYWRVRAIDNHGDPSFLWIGEVDFLDADGNDVPTTGGSFIASNLGSEPSGNEADKAFNGNGGTTFWASTDVTDVFVGYQYASAQSIAGVRITNGDNSNIDPNIKSAALEYSSDGVAWTELFAFTNPEIRNATMTYNQDWLDAVDAGARHYWRVYIPTTNGGSLVFCTELELRATAGGADQTPVMASNINGPTGRVIFSGEAGGNEAFRAFDGVGGSNGWGVVSAPPEWIGFIFTEPKDIAQIMYQAGTNASQWTPTEIQLQSSIDGDTWDTVQTWSSLTFTNSEQKVLSV